MAQKQPHGFGAVTLVPVLFFSDEDAQLAAAISPVDLDEAAVSNRRPGFSVADLDHHSMFRRRQAHHVFEPFFFLSLGERQIETKTAAYFGVVQPGHEPWQIFPLHSSQS